jgi:hypothetical protein
MSSSRVKGLKYSFSLLQYLLHEWVEPFLLFLTETFSSFVALNCVNIRNWQTTGSLLTVYLVSNNQNHGRYCACQHFVLYLAPAVRYVRWMTIVLNSHCYCDKINGLVFIIGKHSVLCEAKADVLCVIFVSGFRCLTVTQDCRCRRSAGG